MNIGEGQDALLESLINTKPVVRRSSEPPGSVSAQQIQAALNKERNERRRRRAEQRSYSVTRKTVSRFRSKLILFDPEEMCLCGLLSITHSVHLIVCIEIFFALVLLIQAPDLLTMDGKYFYFLGLFDGTGVFFFSLHVSVCVTCIISSGILYLGSRKQIASLILPHLFWQFSFILISLSAIIKGVTAAIIIGFLTESLTILSQLNEYRETLYIIFGIVCLVSWLCFNLWALREFFCPAIFGRRPNPSEDRLAFIKLKYVSSGKFLINLTNQNRREEIEMNNLQIFVV